MNSQAQATYETLQSVTGEKYKYGFITDIEAETAPKGLNEDIIRFISAKKREPEWLLEWRLKAYRYWLTMPEPRWAMVDFPPIDYQDAYYYSAPKIKDKPKSLRLAEVLASQDLREFVDGPSWAKRFIAAALARAGRPRLLASYLLSRGHFIQHLGFNPGQAFLTWVEKVLAAHGIKNTADLKARMAHVPPGLRMRDGSQLLNAHERAQLAIIAAEVVTETKVTFPEMAPLFWKDPDAVSPACFVRASMSIPYFFHPFRPDPNDLPRGSAARTNWSRLASYDQAIPEHVAFISSCAAHERLGDGRLVLPEPVAVGPDDARGDVAEFGPDRPLVQVPVVEPARQAPGGLGPPEPDQQLRVVEPAQLPTRQVRRLEQPLGRPPERGERVAFDGAERRLSLSGTPFRSDTSSIPFEGGRSARSRGTTNTQPSACSPARR